MPISVSISKTSRSRASARVIELRAAIVFAAAVALAGCAGGNANLRAGSGIDDLMREAYARVWKVNFSLVRDGRNLLFTVGNNVLKDEFRRAGVVSPDSAEELEVFEFEVVPGPERWPNARQQYEHLLQAVTRLAPQRRAVFEAGKFDGLPVREIARRLGISQRTVENDMAFALYDVMTMMLGDEPESHCRIRESDDRSGTTKRN